MGILPKQQSKRTLTTCDDINCDDGMPKKMPSLLRKRPSKFANNDDRSFEATAGSNLSPYHVRLLIGFNIILLLIRILSFENNLITDYKVRSKVLDIQSEELDTKMKDPQLQIRLNLRLSPLSSEMKDGCWAWEGPLSQKAVKQVLSEPPPKGIVLTMVTGSVPKEYVCAFFPSHFEYFLQPQGLDMLYVLPHDDEPTKQQILNCLNLSDQKPVNYRIWHNLDGSKLKAWEYTCDNMILKNSTTINNVKPISVFLAETEVELPQYVKNNPATLNHKIKNPGCQASVNYIQGTRWYIYEFLHLSILKEYEYFLKIDNDVVFRKRLEIHLLHDMKIRGAVFGHTARFADKMRMPCGERSTDSLQDFRDHYQSIKSIWNSHGEAEASSLISDKNRSVLHLDWIRNSGWNGNICSVDHPKMHMPHDLYYTNLIVGRTDYFQSPEVLALGQFMSEYPHGFFENRWGDQIFWHFALGCFIPNFEDFVVADYSDLRCAPLKNCWSIFDYGQFPQPQLLCDNGGIFSHTKDRTRFKTSWSKVNVTAAFIPTKQHSSPYVSNYKHECPASY
jgi:hypothetical protein